MSLRVGKRAKKQYIDICRKSVKKCQREGLPINYKIRRAAELGEHIHTYSNGNKVIRYYHLNLLVNDHKILTLWRDTTFPPYNVSEADKEIHKNQEFENVL